MLSVTTERLIREVAPRWEDAFGEPGFEFELGTIGACPKCGKRHIRLYFETDWDEKEDDHPERAYVLDFYAGGGSSGVGVAYFEDGERIVASVMRVDDLHEFLSSSADLVAESMRSLRQVAPSSGDKVLCRAEMN